MAVPNRNYKTISKTVPGAPLTDMIGWFKGNKNAPATNNRYSVQFSTPIIFGGGGGTQADQKKISYYGGDVFTLEAGNNARLLNYYAQNVNLPSRQVTTSAITTVGSAYNYATSSTFSQISIDFLLPRSHATRNIFERWIQLMSSDANQYTDYYDSYVCPSLKIFKWERGGGHRLPLTQSFLDKLAKLGIDVKDVPKYHTDQLVAVYDLWNVFPFNIGSMQLSQEAASTMTMSVGFYYERYRMYVDDNVDAVSPVKSAVGGDRVSGSS